MKARVYIALAVLALALSSCAHVVSKEVLTSSEKNISFSQVRKDIPAHKGKTFVLGGFIVKTVNETDATTIEVVQNPIDDYGLVVDTDLSEGRFLAVSKEPLDPMIYESGRIVTVAGKLIDEKKAHIDKMEYTYPVFEILEIYLWKDIPVPAPDYYPWERHPNYGWGPAWVYTPYNPY